MIKVEEEKNRDEKVPKREAVCAKIRQGLKEQSAAVWLELGGVYVCVGVVGRQELVRVEAPGAMGRGRGKFINYVK